MNRSQFYVDFNEMPEPDLVLLSKSDIKLDSQGNAVSLEEGMSIDVFMDDLDAAGNVDNLIAAGVVELNRSDDWSRHVKWCCRIDEKGIRRQSEL